MTMLRTPANLDGLLKFDDAERTGVLSKMPSRSSFLPAE